MHVVAKMGKRESKNTKHHEGVEMLHNKSFIDQAITFKKARYWPRSLFVFLWSLTSAQSIKMQKENLANIQPS